MTDDLITLDKLRELSERVEVARSRVVGSRDDHEYRAYSGQMVESSEELTDASVAYVRQLLAQPAGSGGVAVNAGMVNAMNYLCNVLGNPESAFSDERGVDIALIRMAAERLAAAPASPQGSCNWAFDMDHGWSTDCGHLYTIMEGSPHENEMIHCCFCGKHVTESRMHESDDEPSSGDGRGVA